MFLRPLLILFGIDNPKSTDKIYPVPGCLFFLSAWYTRKELAFRTALLYSGSLLSGAFSGLIAAGITNSLDHARGMRAWRWLFIIEGSITIFLAFCAIFVLPDFPHTTRWLSPEEKQLAVWRLDEDVGEEDRADNEKQTFAHGFVLACKDIKMWIMVCDSSPPAQFSSLNSLCPKSHCSALPFSYPTPSVQHANSTRFS